MNPDADAGIATLLDVVLQDTIGDNQEYIPYSATAEVIDKSTGNTVTAIKSNGTDEINGFAIAGQQITYTYGDMPLNNKLVFHFQTKLKDNVSQAGTVTVETGACAAFDYMKNETESVTYTSENQKAAAELVFQDVSSYFTKMATKTNRSNHSITWVLTVNEDGINTLENAFLSDDITADGRMVYDPASFQINQDGTDSTATTTIHSVLVDKTGEKNRDNTGIDWQVVFNKNQITLNQPVWDDQLEDNLVLDEDSVKLYQATVKEDGTVTIGNLADNVIYNYTLSASNLMSITMNGKIKDAYVLKYTTYPKVKGVYTNTISLRGYDSKEYSSEDTCDAINIDVNAGGTLTRGSLTVYKYGKDGETEIPLSGAVFTLTRIRADGIKVLKTFTATDAEGKATLENLPYGTYELQEIIAPLGYKLDSEAVFVTVNTTTNKQVSVQNAKQEPVTSSTPESTSTPVATNTPTASVPVTSSTPVTSNVPTRKPIITTPAVTASEVPAVPSETPAQTTKPNVSSSTVSTKVTVDKTELEVVIHDKDTNEPIPNAKVEIENTEIV